MNEITKARRFAVCAVITLVMTVSYVDRQTLAALSPTVRPALHLTQTHYGWITGAFSIAYLIFAPLSGWLVDRLGARRTIVVAVALWSLVSASHAFLPTTPGTAFLLLFCARILLGVMEAPSFPAAAQTVRRMLPASDRGTGYGLLFTGSSIGGMIVAPIAIALAVAYGWRWSFALVAVIGMAWVPLWLVVSRPAHEILDREPVDSPKRPLDRSDASAMARAVVLVASCAPLIMFVFNWYPQLLKDSFHVPQESLGKYLWIPPLLFDLGSVGFGHVAGKRASHEKRDLIALGALLCLALVFVQRMPGPISASILGGLALTGGGALYSVLTQEMLRCVPSDRVSAAGGTTAAAQSLSHIIAAPLVGRAIDRAHGSYWPAMTTLGLMVIPGALIWILWPAPTRRE